MVAQLAKKVVKNTLFYTFATTIENIVNIFLIIILARYLGAKEFGIYTLALAFVGLFIFLFEPGLSPLLIKKISGGFQDEAGYASNAIGLQIVTSTAGFLIILASTYLLNYSPSVLTVIYLVSVWVILNSITSTIRAVFMAKQNAKVDASLTAIMSLLTGLVILMAVQYKSNLSVIVIFYIIMAAFNIKLRSHFLRKYYFSLKVKFEGLREIFFESFPFAVQMVFTLIYFNIDSVMLSKFINEEAVGIYNAAYKPVIALMLISTNISMASYPEIGRRLSISEDNNAIHLFNQTAKYLLAISLPVAVGTSVLSDRITLFLYGSSYIAASGVLSVIIWVIPFIYITNFMGRVLTLLNRERLVAWIAGVGALVNVLLNIKFIPLYGPRGAAFTTVFTELVIFVLQFILLYRRFYVFLDKAVILKTIFSCSVMWLVLSAFEYAVMDVHVLVLIAIGAATYLLTAFAIRMVSLGEIRSFLRQDGLERFKG